MHFSWRIQDPARTPERKKNVNQLRFVRSCPFPSNLTKLSFVRSPRCVVPSRKAAATARIGEVWYYIKLCGATRGFARRKLPGWGCSVKEIESFFPPVLVLVSATEHRSFDFGETVMRDETRSGEGRGGEGGEGFREIVSRENVEGGREESWRGGWLGLERKYRFDFSLSTGRTVFPLRDVCGGEDRNEPWEYIRSDETDSDFHRVTFRAIFRVLR